MVAWKLEEAFGGKKKVHLEMLAQDGIKLVDNYRKLLSLKRRPDAVLIYSGHNEFQGRFAWSRTVDADKTVNVAVNPYNPWRSSLEPAMPMEVLHLRGSFSPLCRLIRAALARHFVYSPPPPYVTRPMLDRPAFSEDEYNAILAEFEWQLEAITTFCDRVGAIPILLIPPANTARFEPTRSARLPARMRKKAIIHGRVSRRANAEVDPAKAITQYRELLKRHPEFAETHFRLARMLEASGEFALANEHDQRARDLDGWPERTQQPFQDAYRRVAAKHERAILIDGPAVCVAKAPNGLPGDQLFVDPCHPSLIGHVALAEAVIQGLHQRRVWDLPNDRIPTLAAAECAAHFGIGKKDWIEVARKSSDTYRGTAFERYDPLDRLRTRLRQFRRQREFDTACPSMNRDWIICDSRCLQLRFPPRDRPQSGRLDPSRFKPSSVRFQHIEIQPPWRSSLGFPPTTTTRRRRWWSTARSWQPLRRSDSLARSTTMAIPPARWNGCLHQARLNCRGPGLGGLLRQASSQIRAAYRDLPGFCASRAFSSFRKAMPLWLRTKLFLPQEIRKQLGGAMQKRIVFTEHHESHAASAFFPSPFDEAAVLTIDGVGEWATASFGTGRGNVRLDASDSRFRIRLACSTRRSRTTRALRSTAANTR